MKIRLLGAASLAALALAVAACAKDETKYAEDDTATTESTTTDSTTATDSYAANDPAATDTATPSAADPYATPSTTASPTTGALAAGEQPTGASSQYGVTTAGEVIEIAEINTKTDAERVASDAFDKADANGDGKLDKAEYVMIAMGANEFRSASSPIDETQEGVGEGDMDTGDAAVDSTAPADPSMPATAETATVDETSVEPAFAEAAGADNELTKDELRTAFLARFDTADADKDQQLSETERQTFAELTTGDTTP